MVAQLKRSLRSVILALLVNLFSSPKYQWGEKKILRLVAKVRRVGFTSFAIWLFAFGYFAAYTPFAALTKGLSKGWIASSTHEPLSGFAILPVSTMVATIVTYSLYSRLDWWRYATQWKVGGKHGVLLPGELVLLTRVIAMGSYALIAVFHPLEGRSDSLSIPRQMWYGLVKARMEEMYLPGPRWQTFLAGIATAGILLTTTMAYALEGVSITFIMLLLRGLVLLIGPPLDKIRGKKISKWSWVATALSVLGLVVAFLEKKGYQLSIIAILDVTIYLFGYIVRLWAMDKLGKSEDPAVRRGYIVEEQMVVTPAALLIIVIVALVGKGEIADQIRYGFIKVSCTPAFLWVVAIGALSQASGTFGGLVLLDNRGTSFCLPVNRASSILAGVLGEAVLMNALGKGMPSGHQLIGAACVIGALLVLSLPDVLHKRQEAKKKALALASDTSPQSFPVNEQQGPVPIIVTLPSPSLALAPGT